MEFLKIREITGNKEGQSVNLEATLQYRTSVLKWERSAKSPNSKNTTGHRIVGIFEDDTDLIDFVSWSPRFDGDLKINETYSLSHVKVVMNNKNFAKTKHPCQLVLEENCVIQKLNQEPFIRELEIMPISKLANSPNGNTVTVVGKVTSIAPPEQYYSSQIVKCKVQDNSAVVQVSLIGDAIKTCNFAVNDVLLLENITHKIYNQLHVLLGNTGTRYVNPKDRDYSAHLPSNGTPCMDMSPPKSLAATKKISQLDGNFGRAQVAADISATNLSTALYERCPAVKCNSRVTLLDNGLFRCGKCGKDYHVHHNGIKLILDVSADEKKLSVLLFNDLAENFIDRSVNQLLQTDQQDIQKMNESFIGRSFIFTVKPGRTAGEVLCETFKLNDKPLCEKPASKPVVKKLKFGIDSLLN